MPLAPPEGVLLDRDAACRSRLPRLPPSGTLNEASRPVQSRFPKGYRLSRCDREKFRPHYAKSLHSMLNLSDLNDVRPPENLLTSEQETIVLDLGSLAAGHESGTPEARTGDGALGIVSMRSSVVRAVPTSALAVR